MRFEFDGKRLTVTGKNMVVSTANGETVISEAEPVSPGGAAPASTGAKRGRKSNAEKQAAAAAPAAASSQTSFNPAEL